MADDSNEVGGTESVEERVLTAVDTLLLLVGTDAPLGAVLAAIGDVAEVGGGLAGSDDQHRSVAKVYLPGRKAPLPPQGAESHRALVAAAVDRALASGESFALRLPAGPWTCADVVPVTAVASDERVAALVVWGAGAGLRAGSFADLSVRRATRLASIVLTSNEEARSIRRSLLVDPLTGLANRRALDNVLEQLGSSTDRSACAVVSLDIDRFRSLNEELGAEAGDHVLVIVGERLRGALRARDLVARCDGDEFTVVCHEVVDVDEARFVARRLARVVGEPMVVGETELRIELSAGVAFAARGESVSDLVSVAVADRLS